MRRASSHNRRDASSAQPRKMGAQSIPRSSHMSARQHQPFQLEESTIDELHAAIRAGSITCVGIVEHYLKRARAFNGPSSMLVTSDGKPVPAARGTVRAGKPLEFPAQTIPASNIYPDLDRYAGLPLEFGRMQPTASDPSV